MNRRHPFRLRKGGVLPLRVRSRLVPWAWRRVDDGHPARTWAQQEHWALVLESRGIPFVQVTRGRQTSYYVPPLAEGLARVELHGYAAESHRLAPPSPMAPYTSGHGAVLLFVLLLIWHGVRAGWWPWLPFWPEGLGDMWSFLSSAGAVNVVRMKVYHEWYRAATALTLHADSQHILSNVAFGSLFCILLCRAMGLGLGLLLTVAGGTLGNICNALFRQGPLVSMGFSTALFAAVGAMAGGRVIQAHQKRGKALVPLAAGGAILAMLGTEGERTDYGAHIWGLACGVLLGMLAQYLCHRRAMPLWGQWLAGGVALGMLVWAWRLALTAASVRV